LPWRLPIAYLQVIMAPMNRRASATIKVAPPFGALAKLYAPRTAPKAPEINNGVADAFSTLLSLKWEMAEVAPTANFTMCTEALTTAPIVMRIVDDETP